MHVKSHLHQLEFAAAPGGIAAGGLLQATALEAGEGPSGETEVGEGWGDAQLVEGLLLKTRFYYHLIILASKQIHICPNFLFFYR